MKQKPDQLSRQAMRTAKKAAGICVVPTCGSKALDPWERCKVHVFDVRQHVIAQLAALRKR